MTSIIIEGSIDEALTLDGFSVYQIYNCLDSAVTAQLLQAMKPQLNANTSKVYSREMRLMSLCLEMSSKGFPTDAFALVELLWDLEKKAKRALSILHRYCEAIAARPINPNSTKDVPWLFYEHLGLPAIHEYDRKTKQRKVSSDIKALEKLRQQYPIAAPFVNAILAYRENTKMASVFKRGLEPQTQNLRCNFSPSGTETGRFSSQQNPYGRGTNAQNLTNKVRQVIVAPPGWAILNLDLKTAESIAVGFISRCRAYIDACLSGDVHTAGCRLIWPQLSWTGDIKADKAVAESPYYRMFSYRDIMKKGGHGTNYYGTPHTLSAIMGTPKAFVEDFQQQYFTAFPEISEWHLRVIATIQTKGVITNQLGRERRFWGRSDDAATHRAAIAFDPQGLVADVMNEGLMQVQRWLLRNAKHVITETSKTFAGLSAQVHDAGIFFLPKDELPQLIPHIQRELIFPVNFGELGDMIIPSDAMVGRSLTKKPKAGGNRWECLGLRDYSEGMDLSWLDD